MAVYAIGDLHLPGSDIKPMDVFGAHWENHFERICEDWRAKVSGDDIVLLPGDFSWAMTLADAMDDIRAVGALPGRKIMVRGNHDFWWSSLTQVRAAMPDGMYVLQNDSLEMDGIVFCGTRGWTIVGDADDRQQDLKIYRREVIRLEQYGVKQVVYGHLHGQSLRSAFSGRLRGVDYFQVSCDGLGFKLLELPPIESSNKDA